MKAYSKFGINLATFIGGPLAGGFLLSQNFEAFNKPEFVGKSMIIAVIITVVVLAILMLFPETLSGGLPNFLPLVFVGISQFIINKYQSDDFDTFLENDGQFYSSWRAVGFALLFVLITLILALVMFILADFFIA